MPNIDISRDATDPRKHYHGVRMQQGRVLMDDDFNEAARLDAEDARSSIADIIGAAGSPDDGFMLALDGSNNLILSPGTFYLGGLRLEIDATAGEPFNQQSDWLQQGVVASDNLTAVDGQYDLIYLEAWQQPVSAVEDSELFEVALGGADTSARVRTMSRAKVLANIGSGDCSDGWTALQNALSSDGTLGTDCELTTDATLTVGFDDSVAAPDLCSPSISGGYLGADNQAVCVKIVDDSHFTWGFDNASPLYRVTLGTNGAITMLTLPKDQAHYLLAGQIVELLPWSALLDNNQKVAELSGYLTTVTGGYDPDTQSFVIDTTAAGLPSLPFGPDWSAPGVLDEIHDAGPDSNREYFFLRVWNRGSDVTSQPAIAFTAGTAVPLGNTGLQVTFNGKQFRANDFWIIAARPDSPNVLVPWELSTGRAPNGVRRWITPLGIVKWNGSVPNPISDCRPTFLPLTLNGGCCKYTVGDGTSSNGHFTSIQSAVDALPTSGGEICILPGTYIECVIIGDGIHTKNITIHGCGIRSIVVASPPVGGGTPAPVFTITSSSGITIEDLAVTTDQDAPGILVSGDGTKTIKLHGLHVSATTQSGIEVLAGENVTISECEVAMSDVFTPWPAIFFIGTHSLIERNALHVIPRNIWEREEITPNVVSAIEKFKKLMHWKKIPTGAPTTTSTTVAIGSGGLQLGGTCGDVRVRDNWIHGGTGNGITLGSLIEDATGGTTPVTRPGGGQNCDECDPGTIIIEGTPGQSTYQSAGPLKDILIEGNRIEDMGLCGIGVAGFFALTDLHDIIIVRGLTILRNNIQDCLNREVAPFTKTTSDFGAYGGISVADVEDLTIYDNNIVENGWSLDGAPVCGIFVLQGAGIDICRNKIINNGSAFATKRGLKHIPLGRRGGIIIAQALELVLPVESNTGDSEYRAFESYNTALLYAVAPKIRMAARVHDNIVCAPVGQALSITALGPVSVEGNQFMSQGVVHSLTSAESLAATVFILDLGVTLEISSLLDFKTMSSSGYDLSGALDESSTSLTSLLRGLASGNVLFAGNQVTLDLSNSRDGGISGDFAKEASGADSLIVTEKFIIEYISKMVISSILIASLDDIGFSDNQCDAILPTNDNGSMEFMLSHVLLGAWSVRMADNRVKEGIPNAFASAITFGMMNATTNNQATHCIFPIGPAKWKVDQGNRILYKTKLCGGVGSLDVWIRETDSSLSNETPQTNL
jgi:hypothetical protein